MHELPPDLGEGLDQRMEPKERERHIRRYEYCDVHGELIATAVAEYAACTPENISPDVRNFLTARSLALPEMELVSLFFEKDATRVSMSDVIGQTGRLFIIKEGYRCVNRGDVLVPEPTTLIDILIMLHEVGHSKQWDDVRFPKEASESPQSMRSSDYRALHVLAKEYADDPTATSAYIHELQRLDTKSQGTGDLQRAAELNKEFEAIYEAHETEIRDLFHTMKFLREKDATRRALLWIRKLKLLGIDLLARVEVSADRIGKVKKLRGSRKRGGQDADSILDRVCVDGNANVIEYGSIGVLAHPSQKMALKRKRRAE